MQIFDPIGWIVQPLLLALLAFVVAAWFVALALAWLPTVRSWVFRVGLLGPGRHHTAQLARYDRVCRACAYPIHNEARCPECGTSIAAGTTIRAAELRTWAARHPRAWLRYATIVALLASLSFFGGRGVFALGNRMQWGAARPEQTNLRMVYAPVMSWAYARTVELPIGPDYRVHFDSTFIADPDFFKSPKDARPPGGEVICWIGPAPAAITPTTQEIERFTALAGVGPERFPAMARTGGAIPYRDLDAIACPPDHVAVRIDLPSEAWSTIGRGHPSKRGVGAASALEALYEHAGLLNAWHGSAPERAAMAKPMDLHLRGGHLRVITAGEMPDEDFGMSCVGSRKSWTTIPVRRQPVGLTLCALVQLVVLTLIAILARRHHLKRRRGRADLSR